MLKTANNTKKNKFIVFSNKRIFYDNGDNFNIISVKLKNLLSSPAQQSLSVSSFSKCNLCSFIKTSNSDLCFCQVSSGNGRVFSDIEFIRANSLQAPKPDVKQAKSDARVLIFCIDVSGSMANHRLNVVKKACDSTLDVIKNNAMNDKYKIGLVTFSDDTKMLLCDNTNITLPRIDPNTFKHSDDIKAHAYLKSSNMRLDLLRDCEANLRRRIQSITSESNTFICTALFYSVLLASETPDSEIILCTDGAASDLNSDFYDVIIQFAKLNLTRINVITFADCDCGLYLLGKLASETNGKLSQSTNGLDLKFDQIIAENIKEQQSGTFMPSQNINIYLHSSKTNTLYFIFDGGKKDNSVLMKNLNSKTEEVLLGFSLSTQPSTSNVIFQLIIDLSGNLSDLESATRLRVVQFSQPIGVHNNGQNLIDNEQLVHAFVCRQVTESLVNTVTSDNIDPIRNLVKKYRESKYLKRKPNDVEKLIDLFENRYPNSTSIIKDNIKINDTDAAIVFALKNVTSNKFSESPGMSDDDYEDDNDSKYEENASNYEKLNQELNSQIDNLENILLTASSVCDKRPELRKKAKLMVKSSKMHTKNSNIRFFLLSVLSELLKELKLSTKYTILLKSKENTKTKSQSGINQTVLEDGFSNSNTYCKKNSINQTNVKNLGCMKTCNSKQAAPFLFNGQQDNAHTAPFSFGLCVSSATIPCATASSPLGQSSPRTTLSSSTSASISNIHYFSSQNSNNNNKNVTSNSNEANSVFGTGTSCFNPALPQPGLCNFQQDKQSVIKPENDNASQCSNTDEEFSDCMDIFDRVLKSLRNASSQLATKQSVDELVNEIKSKLFMLIMPEVEEFMSNSLSATEKIVEHLKELDVYDDDHT